MALLASSKVSPSPWPPKGGCSRASREHTTTGTFDGHSGVAWKPSSAGDSQYEHVGLHTITREVAQVEAC